MTFLTTRTPHRVSFFGGGTDYPKRYREHGGKVISAAIDKYCYITCRHLPPYFDYPHRIVWSHIENVSNISDILHPAIREGLKMLGFSNEKGIELHHMGDIPARSGMGSSSAFANGLILALKALKGESIQPTELFHEAIRLEQDCLKENVGSQDQVATALGGLNVIEFQKDGGIVVTPLKDEIAPHRLERFQKNLMLFYSGTSRTSSGLAGEIINSIDQKGHELSQMAAQASDACEILTGMNDLDDIGYMLDQAWQYKRSLTDNISNTRIDDIYQRAIAAGAIGGKLLGAGASGFLLFYVPEHKQQSVRDALNLLHLPFKFDFTGSTIM